MGFTERPEYQNAREIAVEIMEHFSKGDYKEVYLVYTKFVSAISAIPQTIKLLPLQHQSPPIINLLLNIFMNHQHNQCLDIYYRNILLQQYMHHYYNQQQVN